jgi:hypothetical protein
MIEQEHLTPVRRARRGFYFLIVVVMTITVGVAIWVY